MKYIVAIVLAVLLYSYFDNRNTDKLYTFYYSSCVAIPGQVSLMKWKDGNPQCTRTEELKQKTDNLHNWKQFM